MKRIRCPMMFIFLILTGFARADISDKNAQLLQAAKDGSLPTAQTLLADGADVNVRADDGSTALGLARKFSHTSIVELLEKAGAKE